MKKFMGSEFVYIDSSLWKALVDPNDYFFEKAEKIWGSLKKEDIRLLTTNYILDESFTLIRKRCGIEIINIFRDHLVSDWKNVKIIRVTIADESNAWKWFLNDWSKLSFTDCTSFAVMKRLSIDRAATFDSHFAKAGFTIIN